MTSFGYFAAGYATCWVVTALVAALETWVDKKIEEEVERENNERSCKEVMESIQNP